MNLPEILAALELHPSAEQTARLLLYLDLLERWNATYNLTSVRDRQAMLSQHLADCLAVIHPLQRQSPSPCRVLDVGSGGGLPGLVIAALLPAYQVTCIDAVAKKAAFVRQAAGALALPNLRPVHGRVESLKTAEFDVITARAFASLGDLVRLTRPALAHTGCWMAMKGRPPTEEIAALPAGVDAFHVEHLKVPGLEAQRCLVWIRTANDTPAV